MKKTLAALLVCTFFVVGVSAQSTNSSPYCLPVFAPTNNSGSTQNYIYQVQLGTFNNVTPTLYSGSSYVFYNNLSPLPIHVSSTDILQLQLVMGNGGTSGVGASAIVYIDYNHNNVFDNAENLYQSGGYTSGANINAPVPLPTTALYGNTRMRIQWAEGSSYDPCQSSFSPADDFGAVADYVVSISDTYPIATTTYASSINPTSATLNGLINANYSAASADSFQYGLTTAYGNTIATNSVWELTDSTVSTVITGLTHGTTYHYRIEGTNSNGTNYGRDTTFTTPITTGISNQKTSLQVNVYPNPVMDVLHIDNLSQSVYYNIQNIAGSTMKKGDLQAGNNTLSINTLPSGSYILEMYNEEGWNSSVKFVK